MPWDSARLAISRPGGRRPVRGLEPQRSRWIIGLLATCATIVLVQRGASAEPLRSTADLDGVYLALGPVAAVVHDPEGWDGVFGGELTVARVTEHRPVAAVAINLGGARFGKRNAGRLWLEGMIGTRRLLGLAWGVAAGPTLEVDEQIPPRAGVQGSVWLYAGVLPYLRVGAVRDGGRFIEIGLKVSLPAVRW